MVAIDASLRPRHSTPLASWNPGDQVDPGSALLPAANERPNVRRERRERGLVQVHHVAAEVVFDGEAVPGDAAVVEGVLDTVEGGRQVVEAGRCEDAEVAVGGRRLGQIVRGVEKA